MLFLPLTSLPVGASNPTDPDADEDKDSDGYDANRDGVMSDEEKYTNLEEYHNNTNPNDPDTDGGGAWDGWEIYYGFNPKSSTDDSLDSDSDSLVNSLEFYWDSNPFSSDSDQDGMPDGWEDSYSDRVTDGCGLDPTNGNDKFGDPDKDGSDNLREYKEGTNPCDFDSDDDGSGDGEDPPPIDPEEPPNTNPDTGETDGNVTIYEIFDPMLGSLKRWTALDALSYDNSSSNPYSMYNFDSTKTEIFPTNYSGYSQIFEAWIWMGISVSTDSYTRIFSVTPDADIIDYDPNSTDIQLRFFKDGSDNYYVQSNQNAVIDLKYRMGTNGSYFNRPISSDLTLNDLPERSIRPIGEADEVKENVREFLQYRHDNGTIANEPLYWLWPENGEPETNLALIINNLTWYFSAFIEGDGDVPDPEPPWDVYQSICINGIGACRHRSFGFFVTALALGAPTRYVSNEAHAFVEVYVPEDNTIYSSSHWKRINLGGTGSSNTLDRPDEDGEGEEEDNFDFDDSNPDDIDNMTGELVTIVITEVSPVDKVNKGDSLRIKGYAEDQNGTKLPNFEVGFGMWDKEHTEPAFEIGQGLTNSSGHFDVNATDFLAAILGENEIYAASYKQGFLGVDGPKDIDVFSDAVLVMDAPPSVGKGLDLIISGTLKDIGDVPIVGETIEFDIWEGGNPDSNRFRCPPTNNWHRYRCDIGTAETDEFGNFVFSWLVPEEGEPVKDDDYHTESLFRGSAYTSNADPDNDALNVVSTIDLIILDSSVDLTADIEPAEEYIGGTFWINGTISAEAIDNGNIKIEIAGSEIEDIEVTEATWTISLEVPSSLSSGNYTVIVKFVSSNILLPDERVNLNLTILGNSKIEIDIASQKVTRGQGASLEGELMDHLGEPLAGEEIIIKWDDVEIAKVTTETDGDFGFEYLVPSIHSLGNVSWSAEFTGNSLHSGSTESQLSVVFQQTVIVVQSDKPHFYSGESMTINGSLEMDNGTLLSGILAFYFDDVYLESFSTNGSYSFDYIPDASYINVGLHVIEIRYSEIDYNLEGKNSADIYLHRKVYIEIEEKQALRDAEIKIQGFARDESSFGIAEIDLQFYWGDNELDGTEATLFGGSYSKSYMVPNAQLLGKVKVSVIFDNTTSPFYDNATSEIDFTVVSETLIHLPDMEIIRGEKVWFNGTIFDDRDQPVEVIEVNIFWDDEYIKKVTGDSNGTFSFECEADWPCSDLDHPVGIIPIEMIFGGIGYYLPSKYTANYTIWGHTVIEVTDYSEVVVAGQNVTFSGFIENDLGVPLDREITILLDGMTRTKINSVNGIFSGSFVISDNTIAGNHTLTASIDDYNFLRGSSDDSTVLVMRDTEITLQWLGGFRNSTSLVTGYLRDSTGLGLENHIIEIYFDEKYIGNTITEESGLFSYDFFVDGDVVLGLHMVETRFEGSYFYTKSDDSVKSDIQARTFFTVESLEVLRLQEFSVTASLVDDLGNPMINQAVNLSFGDLRHELFTDSIGLVQKNMSLPSTQALGIYQLYWDYNGFGFYLPAFQEQTMIVTAATSISIFSDSKVLVGESFSFNGTVVDDMGHPLQTNLNFLFDGAYVGELKTDINGTFSHDYIVPHYSSAGYNTITVNYVPQEFYLSSSSSWQLQVLHNIRIEITKLSFADPCSNSTSEIASYNSFDGFKGVLNSTVTISGFVCDSANRPISDLSLKLFMDSDIPLLGETDSVGRFSIPLQIPFGVELGNHNLTVSYKGNEKYILNSTTSQILIQGATLIQLEVPSSLEYNQDYVGEITLMRNDGSLIPGASLLVTFEPGGMTLLVTTDSNGTASFESTFKGNSTFPVKIEIIYTGDQHHIGNNIERTIAYRPPVEQSNYAFWVIIGAALVGGSGLMLGWKWYRERHLRDLQRILESTAMAIEDNMDYRDSIVSSYKEMCTVLQKYGYLRRHFETVREFQSALQQALSLDHDSVARLTILYENADYAVSDLDDNHKGRAVSALRTVIASLDSSDELIKV